MDIFTSNALKYTHGKEENQEIIPVASEKLSLIHTHAIAVIYFLEF